MIRKTVVITGATSGIGRYAAIELAKKDYNIIFNYRNEQKAQELISKINESNRDVEAVGYYGDFSSLSSVKDFAHQISKHHSNIDVLINNAGVWEMNRKQSTDGYEMNWAVNHLAPFMLTNLLLPSIRKAPAGRIINVSSLAHEYGVIDFNDINSDLYFDGFKAYRQSKLANVLFTYELARRLSNEKATVNCLHPGIVDTGLFDKMEGNTRAGILSKSVTVEQGAFTLIYLASSEDVEGVSGKYFHKKQAIKSSMASYNEEIAKEVWKISEEQIAKFNKK